MTIEEHYRDTAPKLTNWLVATGSPYSEACDLVQETFVRIWKMRDNLVDNDSSIRGLVFTIARNLRKNEWRDNARMVLVDKVPEIADESTASPDVLPSEEEEERARLRKILEDAFAKLPPMLREAYTLFQIADLSIREIAAQTGVTENLVKVRIFRAKQKLRAMLVEAGVSV